MALRWHLGGDVVPPRMAGKTFRCSNARRLSLRFASIDGPMVSCDRSPIAWILRDSGARFLLGVDEGVEGLLH